MKEYYLVKDKKPEAKLICTTGDERDPSDAFEAATALREIVKTATDCDIDIVFPADRSADGVNVTIAVKGDGTLSDIDLEGDAFAVSVDGSEVKIISGNDDGLWNALAYFVSSVIGYDAYTGDMPEARDTIALPATLAYTFKGTPAPQPLMDIEPCCAFEVSAYGNTYYEEMLRHTAFIHNDVTLPCCLHSDYREALIRKAVAEQRLIWNTTGECHCGECRDRAYKENIHAIGFCKCHACTAAAEREGTECGAYFEIVREAAKRLAALDSKAYLTIAAVNATLEPPKNPLGDNVRVIVSERGLCSAHPIADDSCERNAEFAKKLRAWRKLCGSLYVIDYTSDYYFFPATFPNFGALRRTVAFYKEVGVDGLFLQFDERQSELEFCDIRRYLAKSLLARPCMDAEEYSARIDSALVHFYGSDVAALVRRYVERFTELTGGRCFDTQSRPREILPAVNDSGDGYDLEFAREAYRLWETIHPHPEKLARNKLFFARMLFSRYQTRPVSYAKAQFSDWLMDAVDMRDRGAVIEQIFAD